MAVGGIAGGMPRPAPLVLSSIIGGGPVRVQAEPQSPWGDRWMGARIASWNVGVTVVMRGVRQGHPGREAGPQSHGSQRDNRSETAGSPKYAFGSPDVRPTRRDSL